MFVSFLLIALWFHFTVFVHFVCALLLFNYRMYCRGAIRALEPGCSCYIVCYKCSHVILLFQTSKPDDDDDDNCSLDKPCTEKSTVENRAYLRTMCVLSLDSRVKRRMRDWWWKWWWWQCNITHPFENSRLRRYSVCTSTSIEPEMMNGMNEWKNEWMNKNIFIARSSRPLLSFIYHAWSKFNCQ